MTLCIVAIITLPSLSFLNFPDQEKNKDHFEGFICYSSTIKGKNNKYDSATLQKFISKTDTFFYKEGNTVLQSLPDFRQLYLIKENRVFFEDSWSDTISWKSCGTPGAKVINYKIVPHKEEILGILCDELQVAFEDRVLTCYYNSDTLTIDPDLHQRNTIYNDNFLSGIKKSISLKFVIEREDYVVTTIAKSFSYRRLDDEIFKLRTNKPVKREY